MCWEERGDEKPRCFPPHARAHPSPAAPPPPPPPQGEGDAMAAAMEALLYQHGVDLVFSGHVHAYERHHRVFRGQLNDCAPIHM